MLTLLSATKLITALLTYCWKRFRRTLLRYVRLIARAVRFVCRLSVVCDIVAPHSVEHFSIIFSSSWTRTVCVTILEKNQRCSKWSCKLNWRGLKNWRNTTNISLCFENGTRYGHSYNERRNGTHVMWHCYTLLRQLNFTAVFLHCLY